MPRKNIVLLTFISLLFIAIGSLVLLQKKKLNREPFKGNDSSAAVSSSSSAAQSKEVAPEQGSSESEQEYKKAIALVDAGMLADAEPMLKELLAKNPEDMKVIRELVTLYHTGIPNYGEAMRLDEKILVQEQSNTHEFERYRAIAKLAKAEDRALQFLDDFKVANDKIAFMPQMIRGKIFESKNDYPRAIEAYQAALDIPSDSKGTINELLATTLIKSRKYKDAEPALLSAIEHYEQYNKDHAANPMDRVSPLNAELKLLDVYLNISQYQKALDLANEMLKTDSQNKQLLSSRDMALMGIKGGK